MEYTKIKKLATNYFYDSAFWDTKEEYLQEFNITDLEDIHTFNFLYLIESNANNKEKAVAELLPIFNNCIAFKAVNTKFTDKTIIFHPCTTKDYKYQLSYFDKFGAIMDEKSDTIEESINNYYRNYKEYEIQEVIS